MAEKVEKVGNIKKILPIHLEDKVTPIVNTNFFLRNVLFPKLKSESTPGTLLVPISNFLV